MSTNILEKNNWFKLSARSRVLLYTYLAFFLISSLVVSVCLLIEFHHVKSQIGMEKFAITACISFCLFGASAFYIRKLYKSCINLDLQAPISADDMIRQSGVVFYFLLRPIFSAGFGLLIYLGFKVGTNTLLKSYDLSDNFIYSCMFFSFFIGYNVGDVIDHFEKLGKKIASKAFRSE